MYSYVLVCVRAQIVAGHDDESREDHALRVYRFAEHMLKACESVMIPGGLVHMGKNHIQIRIGIHTGTAYSGELLLLLFVLLLFVASRRLCACGRACKQAGSVRR